MIRIVKGNPSFNSLRWVCLAASKDQKFRPVLTYLHVSIDDMMGEIQFTATDGHRLHRFTGDAEDFEPFGEGLFSVDKLSLSELVITKVNPKDFDAALEYPKVENVFPKFESPRSLSIPTGDTKKISIRYSKVVRLIANEKATIDVEYFRDLISMGCEGEALIETTEDASAGRPIVGAITLTMKKYFGVIMGLPMEDLK